MAVYHIGYSGQENARTVKIPISEYQEQWPETTVTMTYTRPDGNCYNVSGEVQDGYFVWVPNLTDCEVMGYGSCYLSFTNSKTDLLGKSPQFDVKVENGGDQPTTAPDGMKTWVDQMTTLGDTVVRKAAEAESSAQSAAASAETVQNLIPSYDDAIEYLLGGDA